MGKITGFLEIKRETPARRPVAERIRLSSNHNTAPSTARHRK